MNPVAKTTRELVRIASVNPGYDSESPGEAGMTAWLVAWAQENSIPATHHEVYPERENVVLRLRNGADHPHLLLNGHTDTVAVQDMTIPPFGAELRDGRIWGRGSADMKGPLACMLHTLLFLRDNPAAWHGTVTLACVVDEELEFAGIRHFLRDSTDTFDFAIVGEPTRLNVIRGCKGCLRFVLRAHGIAAHSSTPEKGASAISAMAHAVIAMNRYFADTLSAIRHPALGCSTGSIGLIRGGSGVNIVPEFCEVSVDIRLVPGQLWDATYADLQRLIEKECQTDKVRWEFDSAPLKDKPFCLEADHPFVRDVCASRGHAESHVVNFSCDASKIAAKDIPCIILGPGDIAHAHTADESISIEDLDHGLEAYVDIAKRLLPA